MRTASIRPATPAPGVGAAIAALVQQVRGAARKAMAGRPLAISELDDHMLRDMGLAQRSARGTFAAPQGWAVEPRLKMAAPAFLGR